jgi:hypothetical protein
MGENDGIGQEIRLKAVAGRSDEFSTTCTKIRLPKQIPAETVAPSPPRNLAEVRGYGLASTVYEVPKRVNCQLGDEAGPGNIERA